MKLYSSELAPSPLKVLIFIAEKGIKDVEIVNLDLGKLEHKSPEYKAIAPNSKVPALKLDDDTIILETTAICRYLESLYPEPNLFGQSALIRAEVRRLVYWFDNKFNDEVTQYLVGEKIMKRFLGMGEPDSKCVRAGHANIHHHLEYITYLADRRRWLGGNNLSFADIAAAAHLSTIDYLGDVPWDKHPGAKNWYARIKSRPSFQPLLKDHIPGATPAKFYSDLDF